MQAQPLLVGPDLDGRGWFSPAFQRGLVEIHAVGCKDCQTIGLREILWQTGRVERGLRHGIHANQLQGDDRLIRRRTAHPNGLAHGGGHGRDLTLLTELIPNIKWNRLLRSAVNLPIRLTLRGVAGLCKRAQRGVIDEVHTQCQRDTECNGDDDAERAPRLLLDLTPGICFQ